MSVHSRTARAANPGLQKLWMQGVIKQQLTVSPSSFYLLSNQHPKLHHMIVPESKDQVTNTGAETPKVRGLWRWPAADQVD